jgi:hypothetical protein
MLDMFDIIVREGRFNKCFKPGGYMEEDIFDTYSASYWVNIGRT